VVTSFGAAVLGEHIAREEGSGGVGDGVVGVDEIEAMIAETHGEFHRQREGVVARLEKAVAVDLDGMKWMRAVSVGGTEGALVTDEVDFVTTGGEFLPRGSSRMPLPPTLG